MKTFTQAGPGFTLTAELASAGGDLTLALYGGDGPHIGSVSLAEPRQSLTGDGSPRATVSTLNRVGHMDARLGDRWAGALAERTGHVCAVCCGVHLDGLSQAGLAAVLAASEALLARVLEDCTSAGICGML